MEIWKDIEGYEGIYQVSNEGRVRSLDRVIKKTDKYGYIREFKLKGKILKPWFQNEYYSIVNLTEKNHKQIHRLVANAFVPNPDNKPFVDHIIPLSNGGTNCADNLRWVTTKENNNNEKTRKNMSNGRKGCVSPMKGKLNREDVSKPVEQIDLETGEIIKTWKSTMDIKRTLGYDHGNISKCCNGKLKQYKGYIWRYVPL